MKAGEICDALRARFRQPEWALFFEVANGTGANCRRHADALAMNMYPSRGLAILGFEIKVSRSDLKREIENPDKAEAIAQYCNEWWLAVPAGLIHEDDLIPIPWGIMECKDGMLTITKRATNLEPKPITREFMAAVLRSAGKVDEATIREAREQAENKAWKSHEEIVTRKVARVTNKYQAIIQKVNEFEKTTGKRLNHYTDIPDLAKRIKMAENIEEVCGKYGNLRYARKQVKEFLDKTAFLEEVAND